MLTVGHPCKPHGLQGNDPGRLRMKLGSAKQSVPGLKLPESDTELFISHTFKP